MVIITDRDGNEERIDWSDVMAETGVAVMYSVLMLLILIVVSLLEG